jgi:hypothetical protein
LPWSREDVQFCLDDLVAMRHLDYTLIDGTASTIMGLVMEVERLRDLLRRIEDELSYELGVCGLGSEVRAAQNGREDDRG